jgi:DNA-binding IclR family transcriptional regulator
MIEFLADDPRSEYTLSEIARAIDHNKASCSGILHTLEQSGLVSRHPVHKRYSVGPALIRLGAAASDRFRVIGAATTEVSKLATELGLQWNISAPIGGYIVELAASYHRVPLFGLEVGQKVPFAAPVGAVYVAWSSSAGVEAWIARSDATSGAPTKADRHRQSVAAIKQRGYSVGVQSDVYARILEAMSSGLEETAEEEDASDHILSILRESSSDDYSLIDLQPNAKHRVVFIAAPVFSTTRVVAAITLVGFDTPLVEAEIDSVGKRLIEAAKAASHTLEREDLSQP